MKTNTTNTKRHYTHHIKKVSSHLQEAQIFKYWFMRLNCVKFGSNLLSNVDYKAVNDYFDSVNKEAETIVFDYVLTEKDYSDTDLASDVAFNQALSKLRDIIMYSFCYLYARDFITYNEESKSFDNVDLVRKVVTVALSEPNSCFTVKRFDDDLDMNEIMSKHFSLIAAIRDSIAQMYYFGTFIYVTNKEDIQDFFGSDDFKGYVYLGWAECYPSDDFFHAMNHDRLYMFKRIPNWYFLLI